jgi:hypothetical protein
MPYIAEDCPLLSSYGGSVLFCFTGAVEMYAYLLMLSRQLGSRSAEVGGMCV